MSRVEELRASVDETDVEIQRLVARRRELSAQIQSLRLRGGGARHDSDREDQVVASYVRALGSEGAELAEALLRLCRGPAAAARCYLRDDRVERGGAPGARRQGG